MNKTAETLTPDLRELCRRVDEIQGPLAFELNGKTYYLLDATEYDYFNDLESADVERKLKENPDDGDPVPLDELKKELGLSD